MRSSVVVCGVLAQSLFIGELLRAAEPEYPPVPGVSSRESALEARTQIGEVNFRQVLATKHRESTDPKFPGPEIDVQSVSINATYPQPPRQGCIPVDTCWHADFLPVGSTDVDIVTSLIVVDGQLYAAGFFKTAGSDSACCVASWDGNKWSKLGKGLSGGYPAVYAMTSYEGKLIVGGEFTIAGDVPANHIASWDGSTWSSLGLGASGAVLALMVYDGKLIVGGEFTRAGGVGANCIASWDGNTWASIGSYNERRDYPVVSALAEYEGKIIAGGLFSGTTSWDGSAWSQLGSGLWGIAYALVIYDGQLVAGGQFWKADGAFARNIARWNGIEWAPLAQGLEGWVSALAVWDGKLIAGGSFTVAGTCDANNVACWDGSRWSALGSGTNGEILALAILGSSLALGGSFTTAGCNPAVRVARWSGRSRQIHSGPIWHVSTLGSDAFYSGNSEQPFRTIARALSVSETGDTILVATGIYREANPLDFLGKSIVLQSIEGPAETEILPYRTGSIVTFHTGEDSGAVINGFTLKNGLAEQGGAIYVSDSSSPTISNNIFDRNTACLTVGQQSEKHFAAGGAIYCNQGSQPTISHNFFLGNEAMLAAGDEVYPPWRALGGGICCIGSSPRVEGNLFARNRVSCEDSLNVVYGGAVYLLRANAIIAGNTFSNNSSEFSPSGVSHGYGGGVSFDSSSVSITNCLFAYNTGGGLYGSHLSVGTHEISCSNIFGNECLIADWESFPGQARINGNFSADPVFCDTSGNNFHLASTSPCAPENNACGTLIGACGNSCSPTGLDEAVGESLSDLSVEQNYPNPFNPSTSIEYSVPTRRHVILEIVNLLGQHVRTLVDEPKSAGNYKTIWDGTDVTGKAVSTGVYLYRFKAGDFVETKKMVLLK